MTTSATYRAVERHLRVLVDLIGARPPGSPANARATDHVRAVLGRAGLPVQDLRFRTVWWEPGPGRLQGAGADVAVTPDPYSPACDVRAPAVLATSRQEVEVLDCRGRVLVLSGPPAAESVTPMGYPFYRVEEHELLAQAVVASRPEAVVAVSDHWAPVFEDPRLTVPSVTVPSPVGSRIVAGDELHLVLGGKVHEGEASNLSASTAGSGPRVVVSAHVDSKATTPGALDNAGGVAAVLAAVQHGELLHRPVEVVLFNGEDHADPGGELAWLAATDLASVRAAVNVDGAGATARRTEVSTLGCPPAAEAAVHDVVAAHRGWCSGEPWFESDHAVFAARGIPAVAVTSEGAHDLLRTVVHTAADTRDQVDVGRLADLADALPALVDAVAVPVGGAS